MKRNSSTLLLFGFVFSLAFISISAGLKMNRTDETVKKDTTSYTGTIVKKAFENKIGKKSTDQFDYYFETADHQSYFIKLAGSKIDANDLDKHVGKVVNVMAVIENGAWDAASDEHQYTQTRTGDYMRILGFLE